MDCPPHRQEWTVPRIIPEWTVPRIVVPRIVPRISFTTDYVDRVPAAVGGVAGKDGRVRWTATDDPHHRYYRVYCNGRQVASTVATDAKAPQPGIYTVRSVDRWGNSGE